MFIFILPLHFGKIIHPSSVEQKNDDVYYSFDTYAHGIVVKSANEARVEVNPTSLNVNVMLTFFIFVLPLVLAWAIYNALEDRIAFKKDVTAIKRYKYLLSDLVTRDIKTKYRRSALGVLWSVLNPLLMMLVLTAVFSKIIRVEVEGGFALFYLTGYIIFNFISESSNFSLTSMINAGGLIKKVYIPKYIFPLEKTIFSLVNMLFSLIAFVLVFGIFLATGKVEIHATMLLFFIPMIYIFIFAFGLNLILSTLNVFFRDVGHLWGVFVTVWMYATPIIYPINIVPEWLQSIIRFNPLYHYVTYFRNVMIYGTVPSLTDNLICFGFSLIFLLVGITVFRKNQDKFVLHI
jgi:ABC-2 type transport system permease protein